MKRKLLLTCLAVFSAITLHAEFILVDDLWYDIDVSSATASIAHFNSVSGDIEIPSSILYNAVNYTITNINEAAFVDCYYLTSVIIPEGVMSIGRRAFANCSALISVTIPNSVAIIDGYAFYNCSSLTSITIPNNVTGIGDYVFFGCSSLTSIVWNAEDCYISSHAYGAFFDIRTQITSFIFGDNVVIIPPYLCYGMSNLSSITIPNSVADFGYHAFYNCTNLTSFYMERTTPIRLYENLCSGTNTTLYVPCGYAKTYASKQYWDDFIEIEEYGCTPVSSLTLADGDNYSASVATDYDEVTYTRTVWDNDWNLMYVPFAMDVEEMLDEHNMQLYMLNMFHCYDDNHDGAIDRTTIEVMKATEGKTLPNHPYLMKYTGELTAEELANGKDITIEMEDVTLAAAANYQNALKSMSYTYTIYGTYNTISAATATAGHYYSLGTDAEGHVMFGESTGGIRAQRWYYTITDNASQLTIDPATAPVRVVEIAEEATGMAENKTSATIVGYYTLDGMRLNNPIPGAICVARYADGTSKKVLSNQ